MSAHSFKIFLKDASGCLQHLPQTVVWSGVLQQKFFLLEECRQLQYIGSLQWEKRLYLFWEKLYALGF